MNTLNIFTGEVPTDIFLGFCFFATLGIALSLLWHATRRNVNEKTTPVQFNFWFMLRDNWKRIISSVILVYIALRFAPEIINRDLTEFWAFCIGVGFDKISELIKTKTSIFDVSR
jgi:hypothetical protein